MFVGIVTLALLGGDLDVTFRDATAWDVCVGMQI